MLRALRTGLFSLSGPALALTLLTIAPAIAATGSPWLDVPKSSERPLALSTDRLIVPQRYRTMSLDWGVLDRVLNNAPMERSPVAPIAGPVLTLPLPDGGFGRFRVEESPIMDDALAASLSNVKTYRVAGIDDPSAFGRLDTTPAGFHGMIRTSDGTVFIDPYARNENDVYVVYDKRDYHVPASERPVCRVGDSVHAPAKSALPALDWSMLKSDLPTVATNGGTFKTVELAVAASGEYTAFHGGTVAAAQAAITTTINRVNVVYEHDLAIRMTLVDNTAIVFTDANSDPYSNDCDGAQLDVNQTTIDDALGAGSYDLGHVMFGPGGGGGIAGAGPCLIGVNFGNGPENSHAQGCTGSFNPVGDPFDIDFVAHEIGHQWGAPHTFNGSMGSCGGNRSASAAFEPGSGTTIMAYAGICGTDNLQNNSDDYFHGSSLETISNYDPANFFVPQCLQLTPSGNTPPTANAGVDSTIPRNTPFTLCGTGTDPETNNALTFLWEEFDLGPAGPPNNANSAPFFRSFDPTASNCRTFPQLNDILNNVQTNGEILPNVPWDMTFRLTVFDNQPGNFGGGFDQDEVNVTVDGNSGPFRVTGPNTAVTWTGGGQETVTWDVAGTNAAPVSCANVDILFSTDGGQTFNPLLNSTANDGTQQVVAPTVNTNTARIKVQCPINDDVFFDISDVNFSVGAGGNNQTLTVTKDGTGTGTVTSNPAGINCGGTCQSAFPVQTQVTLMATADPGSAFVAWGGACQGTNVNADCVVTMDAAKNALATFDAQGGGCQDDAFETTGDAQSGGGTGTNDACYGNSLGAVPANQTHLHCDEDWVYFDGTAGTTYRIETSNLIGDSDTIISVHEGCGDALATDDDGGSENLASAIEWTATGNADGFVDVKIVQFGNPPEYGPGKGYDISVTEVIPGCPPNLLLANQTVDDAQVFRAQIGIETGPGFVVSDTGSATLTTSTRVVMFNGTSIAGDLTVNLTPNPCTAPRKRALVPVERRR